MPGNVIIQDPKKGRTARVADIDHLKVLSSNVPAFGEPTIQIAYRDYFRNAAGSENMNVTGSLASPVDFNILAHTGSCDRYIKSISFELLGSAARLSDFGNITALTNGVDIIYFNPEVENGFVNISIDGIKSNWELLRLCKGDPAFGNTNNAFRASNVVGASDAYIPFLDVSIVFGLLNGIRLRAGTNDKIIIRINDDLASVTGFTAVASGFDRLSIDWGFQNNIMKLPSINQMKNYSDEVRKSLAYLCDLAYNDKHNLGIDIEYYGKQTDVEFLGLSTKDQVFLVFRGTEYSGVNASLNDIKTNIDFCWNFFDKEYPLYGEVHQGFLIAFNKSINEIVEFINKHKGKKINLIGHSLGGAFATLAAAYICHNERFRGHYVNSIWTFGMPRVGDSKFKHFYDNVLALQNRTKRIVYDDDAATKVPPWLIGYRHIGQEIWLDRVGKSHLKGMPWYKSFFNKISLNALWKDARKDHDIENYYLIGENK